jgi:hypothetical protein
MNRCCFDLFNKVSYSGYKKEEIADLFKSSKVVLDITHPNQKGLTSIFFPMRLDQYNTGPLDVKRTAIATKNTGIISNITTIITSNKSK